MSDSEREKRLAEVRGRLGARTQGRWRHAPWSADLIWNVAPDGDESWVAEGRTPGDVAFIAHAPDDLEWLLAELDTACKLLHDLKEETGYDVGYAEGLKAGVEEGSRRERGRLDLALPYVPASEDAARG